MATNLIHATATMVRAPILGFAVMIFGPEVTTFVREVMTTGPAGTTLGRTRERGKTALGETRVPAMMAPGPTHRPSAIRVWTRGFGTRMHGSTRGRTRPTRVPA